MIYDRPPLVTDEHLSVSCFFSPPHPPSVCKAAKADIVFLVDGSWSIGDDNFQKIIGFLHSTTGALDEIGPEGTQVGLNPSQLMRDNTFHSNRAVNQLEKNSS